jgi:DNA-binding CsgD family transcriptional regulator
MLDYSGAASTVVSMDKKKRKLTGSKEERFRRRVNLQGRQPCQDTPAYKGLGACHEWIGGRSEEGYGKHTFDYKTVPAHRFSWELVNGPIPEGQLVLHRCDNRACVNVEHLFLGSQKDNMVDCQRKGRTSSYDRTNTKWNPATGAAHGSRKHPDARARGARNGSSKLTLTQAEEIRKLYAAGGVSQRKLAQMFGVSQGATAALLKGKTWIT